MTNKVHGGNVKNDTHIIESIQSGREEEEGKSAIIVNLYYPDILDECLRYLGEIAEIADIYIFSSNSIVLERASEKLTGIKNIFVRQKENRGRDLSALLVGARTYLKAYDYICFTHDKKAKHEFLQNDLKWWMNNIWGNTVGSSGYVRNVISLMKEGNYGILMVPKPVGIHMDALYSTPWNDNYEHVVQLAHKLKLEVEIQKEDTDIISLGSAFWCQTDALKKIFTYNWKYEDFPEEPMPDDGTISHAIERIFGFVAIDAGYNVGTIMNGEYAAYMVEMLQEKMQMTYKWLWENLGVKNTYQLENFNREQKIIEEMFTGDKNVYLYGAGNYGVKYLQRLIFWGYRPKGYVVSDGHRESMYCQGFPVKELHELKDERDVEIIITTNPQLQNIIATQLEKIGISYYKAIIV